jgi:hypothetical protein
MTDLQSLKPKDHAEEVAIFRSEIIGALTRRDLDHGELATALKELAAERYRPPGADSTRKYSVPTLERWYYAYKTGSLDALRPEPRSDCGRAQELTVEQRKLLCDILSVRTFSEGTRNSPFAGRTRTGMLGASVRAGQGGSASGSRRARR